MLHIFTSGADGELGDRLRNLLSLVCILVLFEGCQIVLSGIVEVSFRTRSCCSTDALGSIYAWLTAGGRSPAVMPEMLPSDLLNAIDRGRGSSCVALLSI